MTGASLLVAHTPRWRLKESLLKGALLSEIAVFVLATPGGWNALVVGLVPLLAALTLAKWRHGGGGRSLRLAGLIAAVLDHPDVVQTTLVLFLAATGLVLGWPVGATLFAVMAGILAGFLFEGLARWCPPRLASWATGGIVVAAGLVLVAAVETEWLPLHNGAPARAIAFALAVPLYYLFVFAGRHEETDFDIALIALAMGASLAQTSMPLTMRGMILLVPLAVFLAYSERIRVGLAAFKHSLRGIAAEQAGDLAEALWCYSRALALRPGSELAEAGNWRVHARIDPRDLDRPGPLLSLVDPALCLERVRRLVEKDAVAARGECEKLLALVEGRRPEWCRLVELERIRLAVAVPDPPTALERIRGLVALAPGDIEKLPPEDQDAIFTAWTMATGNPLLVAAGSLGWLDEPPLLFSLVAALTAIAKRNPRDDRAASLQPFVYRRLRRRDVLDFSSHADDAMDWLDYRYCLDLARQAAQDGDAPAAAQLYGIAELGLPEERLRIWFSLFQLEEAGSPGARGWLERILELSRSIGVGRLSAQDREVYFFACKKMAEIALASGESGLAIANLEAYSASPSSGLATLETLWNLYAKVGDLVSAVRPIEAALIYELPASERSVWQARKRELYGKLRAQDVLPRWSEVGRNFDFHYCYQCARECWEAADIEATMRWLDLAALGGGSFLRGVNLLLGRVHYRGGRSADAAACWTAAMDKRPKKWHDSAEEEAYFQACRLLGDLYLDELGEPAKAAECYRQYQGYVKSGAETLFRLGRALEAAGRPTEARKWYDMVLVYPSHPRAADARSALARLQTVG